VKDSKRSIKVAIRKMLTKKNSAKVTETFCPLGYRTLKLVLLPVLLLPVLLLLLLLLLLMSACVIESSGEAKNGCLAEAGASGSANGWPMRTASLS
jgi:hypothetical protein